MEKQSKRKIELPNGVLMLFAIIIIVAVLSYLIPAGEFGKMMVDGKEVIDPDSFHIVESNPASLLDVFLAVPKGFQNAIMLLTMIMIIGGCINVFEKSGAIGGAIAASIKALGPKRKEWILVFVTTFFGLLGAFPSMLEACIPFAAICVAVALALGYDLIVGMSMPVIGAVVGWTSGVTNPYTVGIGHGMAGMPLFSGIGYRFIIFVVLMIIGDWFVVRYARKVEKDPSASLVADIPISDSLKQSDMQDMKFTTRHKLIMLVLVLTIAVIVVGTIRFKWDMNMMSAFYIIGAIIAGIIAKFSPNRIVDEFVNGATTIFPACFAVGVARGISIIMTDAKIIDTIVYYASIPLSAAGPTVSASLMVLVQTLLNFFIPSGTGLAMATLPIMLPLGQIVGISNQVTILAFQFGDGLSNLIYPTVPVVVAYLAYTKIPFGRWFRYALPFVILTTIVAIVFTTVAVLINWQ